MSKTIAKRTVRIVFYVIMSPVAVPLAVIFGTAYGIVLAFEWAFDTDLGTGRH